MRYRYWIKAGLQRSAYTLLIAFIYLLVRILFPFEELGFDALLKNSIFGTASHIALFYTLFNLSNYEADISLLLRFGCTRREVFWGLQLLRLIAILPILLVVISICIFAPATAHPPIQKAAVMYLSAYLGGAFGGMAGALIHGRSHGKRVASIVFTLIAAILCIALSEGCIRSIPDSAAAWAWLMLAVNAVICCLCGLSEYKALKTFSVQ